MSQHILLITPYYKPEIAASVPLMEALATGLCERGFRVTVLTSATRQLFPANQGDGNDRCRGLRVIRLWNPFVRRKGLASKLLELIFYFIGIVLRSLWVRDIDVIFVSSSPPLAGLPAALIGFLLRRPIVYNLQDLFPESAVASGMLSRDSATFRAFAAIERAMYRMVNRIIAIDPSFLTHARTVAPKVPVNVIPNWVDTEVMVAKPPADNCFLQGLPCKGKFIVLYAGNMGYLQNLDLILEAADRLSDHPNIHFLFIGDGSQKTTLIQRADTIGLANCTFLEFQPYELLPWTYSACDLGVVPMRGGAGTSSIPSKTWNYFACSRPVLACVDSGSPFAGLVEASGGGLVLAPDDPQSLADQVAHLAAHHQEAEALGMAGRAFVEARFSRKAAVDGYAALIHATIDETGSR